MEAGLLSALFPRKDSVVAFLSHHKEDFAQKNTMRGNLGVAPPRLHTYLLGHKQIKNGSNKSSPISYN